MASAKQTKPKREGVSASHSIREVYGKLAGTLHPDCEPDAAEKMCKTELM